MKFAPSFLKKKKVSKVRRFHDFVNPVRDWLIGLSIAFVVLIGGSAYIAYDFQEQFVETEEVVSLDETPLQYDEKRVRSWSEKFNEREHAFEELRNNRKSPVFEDVVVVENVTEEPLPAVVEMQ